MSEEDSGTDNHVIIHCRSGNECEPGLVRRLVALTSLHAEELTEYIGEAGEREVACYCGTGGD